MSPLLRRSESRPLGPGKGRATRGQAEQDFAAALARCAERTREAEFPPRKVQLLGQMCSGGDYEKVRTYWLKRVPEDVGHWPRRLPADEFAFFLWPLAPGGARNARLGRLKLLTVPGFGTFQRTYTVDAAFHVIAAIWLDSTASERLPCMELLPPVIEVWAVGRRLERHVLDLPVA